MKRAMTFISIVVALLIASIAVAQIGSGYDLTWSTIDGGDGSSSGGGCTADGHPMIVLAFAAGDWAAPVSVWGKLAAW